MDSPSRKEEENQKGKVEEHRGGQQERRRVFLGFPVLPSHAQCGQLEKWTVLCRLQQNSREPIE